MRDGIEYLLWRQTLSDGEVTTVYAVRHPRDVACSRRPLSQPAAPGRLVRDERHRRGGRRRLLPSRSVPAARRALDRRAAAPPRADRGAVRRRGAPASCRGRRVRLLERAAAPGDTARRPAPGRAAARRRRARRLRRRRRSRGLLRRRRPVRLGHHRRPLPARGARDLGRARCSRSRATGAARTSTEGCRCSSSPR